MSPKHYSVLAAVIFTIVAIGQLFRAAVGASVTLDGATIPVWASWIAAIIGGGLAILGFNAAQRS